VFEDPSGKQLLARVCEIGNNCFKVDYLPVTAGASIIYYIIIIKITIRKLLLYNFTEVRLITRKKYLKCLYSTQ